MKVSRIRPLTGAVVAAVVAVAAGVMIVAVGAPPAAAAVTCKRELAVSNVSVVEGTPGPVGRLSFMVSAPGCGAGSVSYRTVAGAHSETTALAGIDYTHTTGSLGWTGLETVHRTVVVPVVAETLGERDEWLLLELYSPSAGMNLRIPVGVGTIVNDDVVDVTPDSEPDCLSVPGKCTARVQSSAQASYDILVRFSTSDGTATAGQDYVPVTQGMMVIPAGSQTASASVIYRQDRVMTGPEYFYINIFDPFTNGVTRLRATIPMP